MPELFDNAPFLAPWYIEENKPAITKDGKILQWKFIKYINEKYVGVNTLTDEFSNVFGFINSDNYIHPSEDKTKFLIWNRSIGIPPAKPWLSVYLYDTAQLAAIDGSDDTTIKFNESGYPFQFSTEPVALINFLVNPAVRESKFEFPEAFKIFKPFISVTGYRNPDGGWDAPLITIMLELFPKEGMINCYIQDWFNNADIDGGYQWITRAVKDNDGYINGQGMRISDFVLDETGSQLR